MSTTALVTGVGRGLGREIARRLATAGTDVWGTTRDGSIDAELGRSLAGCVAVDLADESSIVAGVSVLSSSVESLDLLVNSAGTDARSFGSADDERGPFDFDSATFEAVMSVNVTGPMLVTRHALPLLRRGSGPMIVNISSQLGSMQVAARTGRDTAYCVSKAALNMLGVKSADALRPDGIGVVMLHPGWVQTDMGGGSAPMTVEESSSAIVATIAALTMADTGRFIRWDGHDHPW
ncbi:MAG: SDR family NAD(P)-dependent oxidoreductase [Ilumatobacter sp.]|uniref:SDR family NAD(P)-dependent oxidoreductase n=1 Tax=Ilumatobacter sp. TaxID=1967498 RepID=UPI003296AC17